MPFGFWTRVGEETMYVIRPNEKLSRDKARLIRLSQEDKARLLDLGLSLAAVHSAPASVVPLHVSHASTSVSRSVPLPSVTQDSSPNNTTYIPPPRTQPVKTPHLTTPRPVIHTTTTYPTCQDSSPNNTTSSHTHHHHVPNLSRLLT